MADTLQEAQTVAEVVEDLDGRAASFHLSADPREIFTLVYRNITDRMRIEIVNQGFNDPHWVAELAKDFAGYYVTALDAFDQNDPATSRVWQTVFEAIGVGKFTTGSLSAPAVFGALLMPLVAHIMHDLVFALDDLAAAPVNAIDHERVTNLLCQEIDNVQNTKAGFAPLLGLLNIILLSANETLTCHIVRLMRRRAWEDAECLHGARSQEERVAIQRAVEEKTLRVIEEIRFLLTGRLDLLEILEALPEKIESGATA